MSQSAKSLDVRPSAGQGVPDNQVNVLLRQYCTTLRRLQPTFMVFTGTLDEDIARLHQCIMTKSSQLDIASFGLSMDWRPLHFHTVNANNSSVWDANTINTMGIIYGVTVSPTISQFLCVANL